MEERTKALRRSGFVEVKKAFCPSEALASKYYPTCNYHFYRLGRKIMLFGCSPTFLPVDSLGECDTFCVCHPLLNVEVLYSAGALRRVLHAG